MDRKSKNAHAGVRAPRPGAVISEPGNISRAGPEELSAPAHAGAVSFEVSLPGYLAEWLREKIARGVYQDVREAALLAFQDMHELDLHPEVRRRLFDVTVRALLDDPGPSVPAEEVLSELRAQTQDWVRSEAPPHRNSGK